MILETVVAVTCDSSIFQGCLLRSLVTWNLSLSSHLMGTCPLSGCTGSETKLPSAYGRPNKLAQCVRLWPDLSIQVVLQGIKFTGRSFVGLQSLTPFPNRSKSQNDGPRYGMVPHRNIKVFALLLFQVQTSNVFFLL
jgi:hypothetical protein